MAQLFMPTIQTSSFMDMLTRSDEVQPSTISFIASQQLQTEADVHPTEIPLYSISSGENPPFVQQNTGTMAVDQARFPLVSDEEILEINETAASKNTARATKTWMAVWAEWCQARKNNVNMESYCPQALDGLLNKFYVEIRKKDGTDYEPDSLRVMQTAIDRYLRHKNYPASIITGREFTKSQETLDAKAKQLRRQGKGKRPNKAQPYSETDEEIFWREGKLGNHNGLALTHVNFKNLSETMGFRGRQDHYDAYVEDFSIFQMADGIKVVEFKENPTKTRQGGLRNPTRRSPQQMWSTDGGERDPVKLFEEWLAHRPDALKKSGPLYLSIIPRPISNTWYSKSRMGQHRIGQIMKSVSEDENYLTSPADTCQHHPARQLRFLNISSITFAQFGACSFSKSISYMHERECSTSSSNQSKPSFFISESGRIHQFAVVHVQHGHETISRRHFKFLTVACLTPTTSEVVPVPKS